MPTLRLKLEEGTVIQPDAWYYVYQTTAEPSICFVSKTSPGDKGLPLARGADDTIIYCGTLRSDFHGELICETACMNYDHILNKYRYDDIEIVQ